MAKQKFNITNDELIKRYIELSNKIGKPATVQDLDKTDISSGLYLNRFSTMANLKRIVKLEDRKPKEIYYTKEIIINILIELYIEYNKCLTLKELLKIIKLDKNKYPSYATIYRLFNSTSLVEIWKQIEPLALEKLQTIEQKFNKRPISIKTDRDKQDTYIMFKRDYKRICGQLNRKYITTREWDANKPFVVAKILKRELNLTFTQIIQECGLEVKSGKSSNISNKEVLELRLENKSYGEIAKLYKVSHMTIKRILNNMYPSLDKTTQEQLDNINKQLFCNKKY